MPVLSDRPYSRYDGLAWVTLQIRQPEAQRQFGAVYIGCIPYRRSAGHSNPFGILPRPVVNPYGPLLQRELDLAGVPIVVQDDVIAPLPPTVPLHDCAVPPIRKGRTAIPAPNSMEAPACVFPARTLPAKRSADRFLGRKTSAGHRPGRIC